MLPQPGTLDNYNNYTSFPIPLEKLCSLEVRELLEQGTPRGSGHNESAIKIAKELIGVESYCQANGIDYQGTAKESYEQFLVVSGIDSDGLTESRWKSAIAANPSPSLSPDKIETCLNAWYRQNGSNYSPRPHAPKAKPKAKGLSLPPIEGPVTLAKFYVIPSNFPQHGKPSYIPKRVLEKADKVNATRDQITEIVYPYSNTQFVHRYEYPDPNEQKCYAKDFIQCHINQEGEKEFTKGDKPWPLYREPEVIASNGCPVLNEGEKCVEAARRLGLVSISFQGSNWGESEAIAALTRLKEAGLPGLVFITDNDDAGKTKGKKVLSASAKTGLPIIIIPITQLWEDAPKAGDLADWVKWGTNNGMNTQDFIKRLEIEIHNAVNQRRSQSISPEKQKYQELINELKLIQQETNPSYREFLISELAEKTRKKEAYLNKILQSLEDSTTTPQKTCYTLKELLSFQTNGEDWLIPAYLPIGELITLSAAPKVGKTLLFTSIARAVLTGGFIFGEKVKQGKVLYVTSDESINSVIRRLKASGFDAIPDYLMDNFEVMTNFDITNLSTLQAKLHEFKPDLVGFDSLTSIARNCGLSEKDPEFAKPIYRLRDLLTSVNASGILIHHDNKSKEAKGIEKMSGTYRIAAAAWGIWRLEKEADNPNTRKLIIEPRETEPTAHRLEINPKPLWEEKGIYTYLEEIGDESGEKRTIGQRILNLLKNGDRLEAIEINQVIKAKNIYAVLGRLEDRNLVSTAKSKTTGKTVYFLPCTSDSNDLHPPKNDDNPPPPIFHTDLVVNEPQTIEQQELEPYDHSTTILLSVSLSPATITPVFQGGGEVLLSDDNDPVPSQNSDRPDNSLQWDDLITEIDLLLKKLNWTPDQGKDYLLNKYSVKSRRQLSDNQIFEFLNDLKAMAPDYW